MTDQHPAPPVTGQASEQTPEQTVAPGQPSTPEAVTPGQPVIERPDPVQPAAEAPAAEAPGAGAPTGEKPLHGVGPFTAREAILLALSALIFLASFFSSYTHGYLPIWERTLSWVFAVAIPVAAGVLILVRRLVPSARLRVGSLSVDQFASVAFSIAAIAWLNALVEGIENLIDFGNGVGPTAAVWFGLFASAAGVFFTVLAPLIPPFSGDFDGRAEVTAHPVARDARAVSRRPRLEPQPAAQAWPPQGSAWPPVGQPTPQPHAPQPYGVQEPYGHQPPAGYGQQFPIAVEPAPIVEPTPTADPAPTADPQQTTVIEVQPGAASPAPQAFWALAPDERDVVDAYGTPLFRIGPSAWALVIEDRGDVYVVRHDDGRTGFLHDISSLTRG